MAHLAIIPIVRAKPLLAAILAAMAITSAASAGKADQPESPAAFLERVYRPYQAGNPPPLDGARSRAIFTSEIAALIARDRDEAHGEVGRLSSDPLCDCQDSDGFRGLRVALSLHAVREATKATVTFRIAQTRQTLLHTLRLEAGHWRIADICTRDRRCLRAVLSATL